MKNKKMPQGVRKHIRLQKARIRREVFNCKEQDKLITELYQKFLPKTAEKKDKK